jgi:hypothetical protein
MTPRCKPLPCLWTFIGTLIINITKVVKGGSRGGVDISKIVDNFESKQQGELAALLVFKDFILY